MSTDRLLGLVVLTGMVLLATACRSEPIQGAPGIGDPYYPNLGNGGYDVGHYLIDMDVDPETGEVKAVTTIDARATLALASFNLDFQGLEIDQVTVNGQPASHTRDGSELRIEPAQPLRKGANFETRVVYHGKPGPVQSESGPYEVGWFQAPSGAVNMISEPDGASTWFPVNDHPLDKATYRFEITVPDPWVVAATGKLVQTVAENGRTRFISEMDRPMASCLAAIQIDQYEIERHAGPDGVIIRNYIPKKTYSALTRDLLLLPEMLEFYTARFGPYPYQEYGVVIAREIISLCQGWGSAEENQTLSIHCPNMMSEPVLAHELAHQWFGDSVSLERWEDLWLKEGLATYAEWLWTERNAAPDEFSDFIQAWRDEVAMEMTSPIGHPPADNLYTMEAYVGGALLLDDLRTRMGDEAFFRLLQHYAWKYRHGNAGVEDFIAAAERVSGQDLQAFFDSWLLDTELPPGPPS